jgi:ubiquinone/menaquinone biosynthesis C-methylase UbiE
MDEDLVPQECKAYRSVKYWDDRYQRNKARSYDWLLHYEQLEAILLKEVGNFDIVSCKLLHVGCGNSDFGYKFYRHCERITNIDFSSGVIEKMQDAYGGSHPKMQWLVMDMRKLLNHFEENSFDVVFDKGSLDAIWSDGASQWEPNEETIQDVHDTLNGILRVLRPQGIFVSISFGQPHFRVKHYSISGIQYSLTWSQIGPIYFVYRFVKG